MNQFKKTALSAVIATTSCFSMAIVAETYFLEEIVITAQKRAESLQDVPISVSAMSGDKIADAGIQRFGDVAAYIPNFTMSQQAIGDAINIRGIQSGTQAGFEQSVGTFVDGVYRGRGMQSRFAFLDVEMVEVLRGPQGTLFGKNTIAGALNIRSAKPTEEFEGSVGASYNTDFDETELTGYLSGALTDDVRARLAFVDRQMDEGWVDNSFYNEQGPNTDEQAARLSLEWDLSDETLVSFKYEHGEFDNTVVQPYELMVPGSLTAFGVEAEINGKSNIGNSDPVLDIGSQMTFEGEIDEASLTIEHNLAVGTLTAIVGYSEYEFERFQDADFNPLSVIRFDDTETFEQSSFEIRFASEQGGDLEYIAGAYYQDADLFTDGLTSFSLASLAGLTAGGCAAAGGTTLPYNPATDNPLAVAGAVAAANTGGSAATANACANASLLGPLVGAGVDGANRYASLDQSTESWAIFGQATWNISDEVRATFGIRYTEEDKEAEQAAVAADYAERNTVPTVNPLVGLGAALIGEFTPHSFTGLARDEESLTWSANVQWDVTADVMAYASASTGFKAGGFNSFYFGTVADDADFEEEEVVTLELGSKMSLLNGAAELNVAVFRTEYDDLQAAVFSGQTTFSVENAAKAVTQGIEVDGRWQLSQEWMLAGSLGWIDFEFEDYANQACTNEQFIAFRESVWAGGTNISGAFANNANCSAAGTNDLSGKTSGNTPELSATLSAIYTRAIGNNYELGVNMDLIYSDEMYRQDDLDKVLLADATTKLNAVVRFGPQDDQWQLSLIGKNLTDVDDDFYFGNDVPLFNGSHFISVAEPRSIAVAGNFRF